ncbi:MAG: BON domain-containing protein [Aestuariivirga sp.]|uniref:BON domain-containing protein n=1 Tax=Aestuariivirga sp. TaxID=2650926 RepID=UPI0025C14FDC|nr:BON domain-containing protein [Aestuariivirga sp.]MCA3560659.1 BON domain-containing protein [Aestuariivirga sp.]
MSDLISYLKPLRWLVHLPLAILPFLAAAVIDGPKLGPEIGRRVQAALADAGQGWAKPMVTFRDVEIRGEAPDRAAVERARAAVAGTEGVRHVDMHVGVRSP